MAISNMTALDAVSLKTSYARKTDHVGEVMSEKTKEVKNVHDTMYTP